MKVKIGSIECNVRVGTDEGAVVVQFEVGQVLAGVKIDANAALVIGKELITAADQIKLAEEYVARRGAVTGPRIGVVRDQLQLQWHDDVIASKQDLIGTLCWLAPTSVLSALKREIEAAGALVNAMPAAERINRISELEAQLLALERREEVLISCAAVDGTEVLRRPDANPMAVLGIVVVAKEAQQQVA